MKLSLLTLMLVSLSCFQLFAQSKEPAIEDLKWVANVSDAEASFTFPSTRREQWSWYNHETPDNWREYGWDVMIGDHKSGYHFGPALFKPADSKKTTGSFSDLLKACQHDLWRVSEDGGFNVRGYGEARIVNGKVRVMITDQTLVEQLFKSKPATVYMEIITPEFTFRRKVSIAYGK